jgi:hypothetical protein
MVSGCVPGFIDRFRFRLSVDPVENGQQKVVLPFLLTVFDGPRVSINGSRHSGGRGEGQDQRGRPRWATRLAEGLARAGWIRVCVPEIRNPESADQESVYPRLPTDI